MAKKVIPFGNRVLVELIVETTSPEGILLPNEVVHSGYVRDIGCGVEMALLDNRELKKWGVETPETKIRGLRVGDKVFLPKGSNVGDKFDIDGKLHLVVPPEYVSAILED